MGTLSAVFRFIQQRLFPVIEETAPEPLTDKQREFVRVAELLDLEKHMRPYRGTGMGRPPHDRLSIALAFLAKAVWNLPTTAVLVQFLQDSPNVRRLCGWEGRAEVPSESTFSRAFAAFAGGELGTRVHETLIRAHRQPKLVGHCSHDATAIEARERPVKKAKTAAAPRRRGRPRRGDVREPKPPRRVEVQGGRRLAENLAELPRQCDVGCKRNTKGHPSWWVGYKLHLTVTDGDIPISAILTSASLHDSQVAIPLMQMSAQRVTSLYDLMDSAYDAAEIKAFSRSLQHVPLIDPLPRPGQPLCPLDPAQARRYQERTAAERVNSEVKDNYGGRFVRVRGAAKVMTHLMFGVLAIAAKHLFALLE